MTPVNDPPVATADGPYSTLEGVSLTLPAPGLLANDTDVEGDPLTAVKTANPTHGTLTLNANGGFTYTPAAGYEGADLFTYVSNDGHADSAPATVNITVLPKPATTLSVTTASTAIDYGSTYRFAGILKLGALALPGQTVALEQSTDGTTFSATRSRRSRESAVPSPSARSRPARRGTGRYSPRQAPTSVRRVAPW